VTVCFPSRPIYSDLATHVVVSMTSFANADGGDVWRRTHYSVSTSFHFNQFVILSFTSLLFCMSFPWFGSGSVRDLADLLLSLKGRRKTEEQIRYLVITSDLHSMLASSSRPFRQTSRPLRAHSFSSLGVCFPLASVLLVDHYPDWLRC